MMTTTTETVKEHSKDTARWFARGNEVGYYPIRGEWRVIATCEDPEDARRLAAARNACKNVKTRVLEQASAGQGGGVGSVERLIKAAVAVLNDTHEHECYDCSDEYEGDDEDRDCPYLELTDAAMRLAVR